MSPNVVVPGYQIQIKFQDPTTVPYEMVYSFQDGSLNKIIIDGKNACQYSDIENAMKNQNQPYTWGSYVGGVFSGFNIVWSTPKKATKLQQGATGVVLDNYNGIFSAVVQTLAQMPGSPPTPEPAGTPHTGTWKFISAGQTKVQVSQ